MSTLAKIIATGFYSGYIKPFSGTWGTIPAWAIGFFLIKGELVPLIIISIVTFVASVWSATEAEKMFGHDSKSIVIDEWAGMFITLFFVPVTLTNYLFAFFWFRFFDVAKIPPASQFEKLPRGWGVTMDDIMAGIYACLFTNLTVYAVNYFNIEWLR